MNIEGYELSPDEVGIMPVVELLLKQATDEGINFTFEYDKKDCLIDMSLQGEKVAAFGTLNDMGMYLLGFISAVKLITNKGDSNE